MEQSESSRKNLTFDQLGGLREKTDSISQFLERQLRGYLDTLRPLLHPRRILGKYVGAKEDAAGTDRTLAQLREKFREVCQRPFALSPEFHEETLNDLDGRLELYLWEYAHEARGGAETKPLAIRSPVRWVLTYPCGYTLAQVRQAVTGKDKLQPDVLRQFVLNALVMVFLLKASPNLTRLLTDLRYQVQIEPSPGLGDLPLVTISSCLTSFRPSDELLLMATRFSGVPVFVEVIDPGSVGALQDPLKQRIEDMLC